MLPAAISCYHRVQCSEVDPRLVPGTVFKTVGPYGSIRLVGSIPMHFRFLIRTIACDGYDRLQSDLSGDLQFPALKSVGADRLGYLRTAIYLKSASP